MNWYISYFLPAQCAACGKNWHLMYWYTVRFYIILKIIHRLNTIQTKMLNLNMMYENSVIKKCLKGALPETLLQGNFWKCLTWFGRKINNDQWDGRAKSDRFNFTCIWTECRGLGPNLFWRWEPHLWKWKSLCTESRKSSNKYKIPKWQTKCSCDAEQRSWRRASWWRHTRPGTDLAWRPTRTAWQRGGEAVLRDGS